MKMTQFIIYKSNSYEFIQLNYEVLLKKLLSMLLCIEKFISGVQLITIFELLITLTKILIQ
jgi:hypothetical protein